MTDPLTAERISEIKSLLRYETSISFHSARAKESMLLLVAEVERLRAELARPAIEAERCRVRDVLSTAAAEARDDRDFEGEAELGLRLRAYEAKWAAEDAGRAE
ncbi:hypothetical protein [Streptomyces sp. NPDC001205]